MGRWPVKHHKNRKKTQNLSQAICPPKTGGVRFVLALSQTQMVCQISCGSLPSGTNGLGQVRLFISFFFSLSSKSLVPPTVARGCIDGRGYQLVYYGIVPVTTTVPIRELPLPAFLLVKCRYLLLHLVSIET